MSSKRSYPREGERLHHVRLNSGFNKGGSKRVCAWEGCCEAGHFKAPSDRQELRTYIWFCLDHIREYNQRWDYFADMSAADIEKHRREDTVGHRPTWHMGAGQQTTERSWTDPFQFFGFGGSDGVNPKPPADAKTGEMLAVLSLKEGFSEEDLKAKYKQLVKCHHPDLNGGDRTAEERLKRINEAYSHLKKQFI